MADMIAAEKIRNDFMAFTYKYNEWFNLQWLCLERKFNSDENSISDINEEDNIGLGWGEFHRRKFECLSGDVVGLYEKLGDRGQMLVKRYIEIVNQSFNYNNFNKNLRINFEEVEAQLAA
jgi:hypothetical protein